MVKKRTRNADADKKPPPQRKTTALNLIELKSGLFINEDQIVSVRVLPQEEGAVYAMLQLSNGDKLSLTREEFTAISGEEPRQPMRLSQKTLVE